MKKAEHMARHAKLHRYLDELVADFINQTGKLPSQTPLLELMQWSHGQIENPTGRDQETEVTERGVVMAEQLSKCCKASMTVVDEDEVTKYYACDACKMPCDPMPEVVSYKNLIKYNKTRGYPIGYIISSFLTQMPKGWLECRGQWLKVEDYRRLFSVIGTAYNTTYYRKVIKNFWIFSFTKYEPIDVYKEFGLFRLPNLTGSVVKND